MQDAIGCLRVSAGYSLLILGWGMALFGSIMMLVSLSLAGAQAVIVGCFFAWLGNRIGQTDWRPKR